MDLLKPAHAVMNRLLTLAAAALLGPLAGVPARAAKEGPAASVRVVSQTVGSDEMLLALANPGQIAALSELAQDPEYSAVSRSARGYPTLIPGGDAESVLKYRPTLVLCADYSRAELVAQLRRAGIRVLIFDHYMTLEDAYANLRAVAHELGAEARAERLIAECRRRMAEVQRRLRGVKLVRVIAPSIYGLIPGADTTFQDLCDHAGAVNLAATLGHLRGNAAPPAEQLLTWPVDRMVLGGTNLATALAPFRHLSPYEFMDAVRAGRAVLVRPYLLSCVSFYRVDGYEELARALHPEAFP
jgi:iron complex transport system substrate-binding protein